MDTTVQCYTCGKYHKSPKGLKRLKIWTSLILYYCKTCPQKTPTKPMRAVDDANWEIK
jgi:hypothetical protein